MPVSLGPSERISQTFDNVWYESMERAEKSWKGKIYSDKGTLRLTSKRLFFEGKKFNFSISEVADVWWKKPKGGKLNFICINFRDKQGELDSALFANGGSGWLVGTVKKNTEKLFAAIVEWRKNVLEKERRKPKKETELLVLGYVIDKGGKIDVEECAMGLGVSVDEVEAAIGALEKKGKLERE